MPNWTHNSISVKNTGQGFDELREIFTPINDCDSEPFHLLIPPPSDGVDLDWYCNNWGTKWDAVDTRIHGRNKDEYQIVFRTAWAPPIPIFEEICRRFPDLTVGFDINSMESNHLGAAAYAPDFPFSVVGPAPFFTENYEANSLPLPKEFVDFSKRFSITPFTQWQMKKVGFIKSALTRLIIGIEILKRKNYSNLRKKEVLDLF
ncbi:hypothetical protein [Polynucleobacter sp. MWH-UH23A]|uniref:DUF1281 family ferredoxin-like fold protein n=1 Tax=Polynucleobacter sp. MWH-UH23A TaxID=1855613 RepID=UPI003364BC58